MNAKERAVCERLLAEIDAHMKFYGCRTHALITVAKSMRALLDRPQVQPITEDELGDMWQMKTGGELTFKEFSRLARAVEAHHHIGEKT